ncbi:MAG: hypothetical protein K6G27_06715 [Lachnospiraceae bacterium]|nr:hypothetical protein [Lachnospiraceae bacterium]
MFDWNGNGKIDAGDHAFTAFLIDEMNKEIEAENHTQSDFQNEDDGSDYESEYNDIPDYGDGGDCY